MILSLVGFVQPDDPWFGVGTEDAANIRATALLVAAWYAVFALPLFLFTPDRPATGVPLGRAVREGLKTLLATARRARDFAGIARFLIARMHYTDGLNTILAFGGIYAAGTRSEERRVGKECGSTWRIRGA